MPRIPIRTPIRTLILAGSSAFLAEDLSAQYTVQNISNFAPEVESIPFAVNELGQVVGRGVVDVATRYEEVLAWDGRRPWRIGPAGVEEASGLDVNDSGVIVGEYWPVWSEVRAFRWTRAGGFEDVFAPYGHISQCRATGINDSGVIIGGIKQWSGGTAVILDPVTGLQQLPFLSGGTYLHANAINEAGEVVGYGDRVLSNGSTEKRAFLYSQGQMIELVPPDPLGGSQAHGINAAGTVVGLVWNSAFLMSPAYWDAAGVHVLPVPLGARSPIAADINDAGDIVGAVLVNNPLSNVRGALWRGGIFHYLDDLLEPGSRWSVSTAVDINNAGQVLTYGKYDRGSGWHDDVGAILLEPVTTTLTLHSPVPGETTSWGLTQNSVMANGASPGETIVLFADVATGSTPLGSCAGASLGLANAQSLRSGTSDANGGF